MSANALNKALNCVVWNHNNFGWNLWILCDVRTTKFCGKLKFNDFSLMIDSMQRNKALEYVLEGNVTGMHSYLGSFLLQLNSIQLSELYYFRFGSFFFLCKILENIVLFTCATYLLLIVCVFSIQTILLQTRLESRIWLRTLKKRVRVIVPLGVGAPHRTNHVRTKAYHENDFLNVSNAFCMIQMVTLESFAPRQTNNLLRLDKPTNNIAPKWSNA